MQPEFFPITGVVMAKGNFLVLNFFLIEIIAGQLKNITFLDRIPFPY